MIAQSERKELLKEIKADEDYISAAAIYKQITGRKIYHRYLYRFLKGEIIITGKKPGSHQPLQMWEALVEAIVQRKMKEEMMTREAKAMRERLAA